MKQRKIVSDRRLKASAMEWAKVALRVSEYYLSEKRDARIVTLTKDRQAAENGLLRLCVKLMSRERQKPRRAAGKGRGK